MDCPLPRCIASVLAEEAIEAAIDDYLKKTTGKGLEKKKSHAHDEHHEH